VSNIKVFATSVSFEDIKHLNLKGIRIFGFRQDKTKKNRIQGFVKITEEHPKYA